MERIGKELTKGEKIKDISRSTVAARWRWCPTAAAMKGMSVRYHS